MKKAVLRAKLEKERLENEKDAKKIRKRGNKNGSKKNK